MTAGFCRPLYADENGQVINVNQNYQVAFTDLDNQALKQGQIVKVFVSDDEFVYMQVMESSAILSKLGISQAENYKTNLTDLQRVAIGNKVVPLGKKAAIEEAKDVSSAGGGTQDNDTQLKELSARLREAKSEISHLQQVNLFLKSQMSAASSTPSDPSACQSRDTVALRGKLQKMQQILDQN